jgi:hypothetical protein
VRQPARSDGGALHHHLLAQERVSFGVRHPDLLSA